VHAACTNWVSSRDRFWTIENLKIQRNKRFVVCSQMIPITPRSIFSCRNIYHVVHYRVALEQNPNPTRLDSRFGLFNPEPAWSRPGAISRTIRHDENLSTASTRGAFHHVACHHCTHNIHLIAEFWVVERCSTCVEAWSMLWSGSCTCKNVWACHGPTQQLQFPL
jgi:hypothetical protein